MLSAAAPFSAFLQQMKLLETTTCSTLQTKELTAVMKLITFVVPCYNAAEYMKKCIRTLLCAGEEAEIIIVNDGSSDETSRIAHAFEQAYPAIVRAVDQENGGHGAGVNAGLALAKGLYFKVVDSDDWLDVRSLKKLMCNLRRFSGMAAPVDLAICNYIYDHVHEPEKTMVMSYENVFPIGKVIHWRDMGCMKLSQYLIMHALIFRTDILRAAGVALPHHTFYVDNIFACQPLSRVKSICYLNLNLYHYYIGRADQSVNESVHIGRIDQQIAVTEYILKNVDLRAARSNSMKLETYLIRFISMMLTISDIYLLKIGTAEALQKRQRLWDEVRAFDPLLYYRLRYTTISGLTILPGSIGRKLATGGYAVAHKLYGFN